jgi:hypothetical protein
VESDFGLRYNAPGALGVTRHTTELCKHLARESLAQCVDVVRVGRRCEAEERDVRESGWRSEVLSSSLVQSWQRGGEGSLLVYWEPHHNPYAHSVHSNALDAARSLQSPFLYTHTVAVTVPGQHAAVLMALGIVVKGTGLVALDIHDLSVTWLDSENGNAVSAPPRAISHAPGMRGIMKCFKCHY